MVDKFDEYHVAFLVVNKNSEKYLLEEKYPNIDEAMISYNKYLADDTLRYNKFDYYFKSIIGIDYNKPNKIDIIDSEIYSETEARIEKINRFLENEQ